MKKNDVKRLQQLLNSAGFNAGLLDGILGPMTLGASATYLFEEHADVGCAERALSKLTPVQTSEYLDGIDISGHNGKVDWEAVADAGCKYAWVKATEGTTHKQKSMQRNLDGARAWGIPVGAYHYGRPNTYQSLRLEDARREAENFLKHYGTPQPDDIAPVLDVESGYIKTDHNYNVDWTHEWCRVVEDGIGCKPMIYTARWAVQSRLIKADSLDSLSQYKLWWAEYRPESVMAPTKTMTPWTDWTCWQWTGHGSIDGVNGRVDRNRMKPGELAKLKVYA